MRSSNKRTRSDTRARTDKVLALSTSGLTHKQIATKLNISTKSVQRHIKAVKPAIDMVNDLQARAADYIESVYPIEQRIDNYATLSRKAKNEAVRDSTTRRLDEMQGFVPVRELIRAHQGQDQQPQPMFILPPGANIAVTVNQANTTISREDAGLHKNPTETLTIDTTTSSRNEDSISNDSASMDGDHS